MSRLDGDAHGDEDEEDINPAVQESGLRMFAEADGGTLETQEGAWFWLFGIILLTGARGFGVPVGPPHLGILSRRNDRIVRRGVLVQGRRRRR